MQDTKLKILFVCTINRMRSATAQKIFEQDPRFDVKSAGTDKSANTILTSALIDWADAILVMEKKHRNFIRSNYKSYYDTKKIVCLYIPDDFEFMEPGLISILKIRVEDAFRKGLLG